MKGDTRYTPRDVFETFPRPVQFGSVKIEPIANNLSTYRAELMKSHNEGVTKTYNRFHDPDEHNPQIERLRQLHEQLDHAVRDAYGWEDVDLGHGFHNTKQGIRRTISQDAQTEILDRLLALNHERFENEQNGVIQNG